MPFDLTDDECLLWIKDPSLSPFEKEVGFHSRSLKIRRLILNGEIPKNPKDIVHKVQRKCFYNSALREEIVKRIREWQQNKTLRLYAYDNFTYSDPPFTMKQCKAWAKNHLVNPRTKDAIAMGSKIYTELLYTTLQYGLPTPAVLDVEPTDTSDKVIYKYIQAIIQNVKHRLALMKKTDDLFLHQGIGTVDLPKMKVRKNTFGVSSSSDKSMSQGEKRKLMDMMLENQEEERLIKEYRQFKQSERRTQQQSQQHTYPFFTRIRTFLVSLSNEVEHGTTLINKIVKSYTPKDITSITDAIKKYIEDTKGQEEYKEEFDNIESLVKIYVRNIYSQLLDPSIAPSSSIEYPSYVNMTTYFKNTKLTLNISSHLIDYIDAYTPTLDYQIRAYLFDIVDDMIDERYAVRVVGFNLVPREPAHDETYRNDYYNILSGRQHVKQQPLPQGMKVITSITIENRRISVEKDNADNNFTLEECRDWVMMPILNPRTYKPVLIDSPLYNRLLCLSYQYDTNLVPRMITSFGHRVFDALIASVNATVKRNREKSIRTPSQFEMKWKIFGTKKPEKGIELINEKLRIAIIDDFAGSNGQLPFYVFLSKDDLRSLDIPAEIAKNTYIKVEDINLTPYYYIIVKEGEGERSEIINKPIVVKKRTDYTGIIYSIDECSNWIYEPDRNPRTRMPIIRDSEEYNILFQQTLLFNTNIEPYDISPAGGRYKRKVLKTIPDYYGIGDCLRWVRQPSINPKTGKRIVRDSKEYNTIFEKALLYDSNMRPSDISSYGIKFKNAFLEKKRRLYGYEKVSRYRPAITLDGDGDGIGDGNYSDVCKAIMNIYDGYKYFKDKMKRICKQHHSPPIVSLDVIKTTLKERFIEFDYENGYTIREHFDFYKDSAIASAVLYFYSRRNQLNNPIQKELFSNNYSWIYVSILNIDDEFNITAFDAVDGGGPAREFFTKFFEELFCDDTHLTRPFIKPRDNKEGTYYINPAFELDDNFRKVVAAYEKREGDEMEPQFITDEQIYEIIGRMLSSAVVNEDIGLPQQLSGYILAGLLKQPKDITLYELFYIYLCEFDNTNIYLNMIHNNHIDGLEYAELTFNYHYVISKRSITPENPEGYAVSKENCIKFLQQLAKHVITKNFLNKDDPLSAKSMNMRYASLFAGFDDNIRGLLANSKVSVAQLRRILTNDVRLDKKVLQEFARRIIVEIRGRNSLQAKEKSIHISELRRILYKIITERRKSDHSDFIRKLFRFWTALPHYTETIDYKISYHIGNNSNDVPFAKDRFPQARTCFNSIDFYGFPDNLTTFKQKKKYLYERLHTAVFHTPGMDNA
jgi:hypothetical protein